MVITDGWASMKKENLEALKKKKVKTLTILLSRSHREPDCFEELGSIVKLRDAVTYEETFDFPFIRCYMMKWGRFSLFQTIQNEPPLNGCCENGTTADAKDLPKMLSCLHGYANSRDVGSADFVKLATIGYDTPRLGLAGIAAHKNRVAALEIRSSANGGAIQAEGVDLLPDASKL